MAVSQHLTYALLGDVAQELAVRLRTACLLDRQSELEPRDAAATCHSAEADSFSTLRRESAACRTATQGSFSSLRAELDADIDQLLVDAIASVGGSAAQAGWPNHHQDPTKREKTLRRAVEAVGGATAPVASSALQTGRSGEAVGTDAEAPVSARLEHTKQMAQAATRVQELLADAARAICAGHKSADALVVELVASELVRRLVEAGVGLRPHSHSSWLSFESVSCATVPDAHLELLRHLFVMPPRWAIYRLAFGLSAEGPFASSPRETATIQAASEMGEFLDRLPYDLARSLEVVSRQG
jgi:hypothetical protein